MNELYLPPFAGGRWAISRVIAGKTIYLVQNSSMDEVEDIVVIFRTLDIACTKENRDRFFPVRGRSGPCPTLELLERFSVIDRSIGTAEKPVSV